jgi:hypothetical protein
VNAEERFAALVAEFADRPGVAPPVPGGSGFGADALKVDGRIFAMLVHGDLVVKLPKQRVDELIAGAEGGPFDAGKGKPMKEWVALAATADWPARTREAMDFVASRR